MDASLFVEENFGSVDLGDRRREKRLIQIADRIVQHPGDSLPKKLNSPAELKAMYRLMNHPDVTHEAVHQPHMEHTRKRMSEPGSSVLILHDGTELDYTGLNSIADELGQIGNGKHRGFICHNSLAVEAQSGAVIGLINQILHKRIHRPKNEKRTSSRRRETRESRLWSKATAAIGPTPAGCRWIDVGDRGADIFEFLENELTLGREFVIRSTHNRRILTAEGENATLREHLRSLPSQAERMVAVGGKPGRSSRTAIMSVAYEKVSLLCPQVRSGEHSKEPLVVTAIRTWEANPPSGVEPLEWFLLVKDVADTPQASECVSYYETRWVIEEFHKAMKTGCEIENLQFTTVESLKPTIALLSVVAVFLLILRDMGSRRDLADQPAREHIDQEYVEFLSLARWKTVKLDMTVREFVLALGLLGGHQNRKADGMPGWLTLWRGWTQLQAMMEGARIVEQEKSG
jgi:hypothetical protein